MALASNFPMAALNSHLRSTLNSFASKGRAVGRWRIIIRQRVRGGRPGEGVLLRIDRRGSRLVHIGCKGRRGLGRGREGEQPGSSGGVGHIDLNMVVLHRNFKNYQLLGLAWLSNCDGSFSAISNLTTYSVQPTASRST